MPIGEDLSIREGYAAWAPLYDDDGNPLTAIEGSVLRSWFGPIRGRKVLDLGCGTGRHTLPLVEAGAEVVAVDAVPEMMTLARDKLGLAPVHWVLHRLPDPLPFPDATFDLVVLGLVAEHLEDLEAVLSEAARVTVPGGRSVLSALHPERTAGGQRARFIDPASGERRHITTVHREVADYLGAANRAGWSLIEERTLIVPGELAEVIPRALPYVGKPLGWAARWEKADATVKAEANG
ncbi:class I SAM-dependent methyltransferase [Tundrisphaera lichenicola]|uniref:class I SAM-dependent methyltransferase n=1 Tax=Tundrisphaera lichenicola TaxID=2029860 RepID=UPI003EBD9D77